MNRNNGPLRVDVFGRKIHDQIVTSSKLDSAAAKAAMLDELAQYILNGQIELHATAWDRTNSGAALFDGAPMHARFESSCALCHGRIDLAAPILYNRDRRQAAHESCARASC